LIIAFLADVIHSLPPLVNVARVCVRVRTHKGNGAGLVIHGQVLAIPNATCNRARGPELIECIVVEVTTVHNRPIFVAHRICARRQVGPAGQARGTGGVTRRRWRWHRRREVDVKQLVDLLTRFRVGNTVGPIGVLRCELKGGAQPSKEKEAHDCQLGGGEHFVFVCMALGIYVAWLVEIVATKKREKLEEAYVLL
jgi:hypothetical protein